MKKVLSILLALALLGCGLAALAETGPVDVTYNGRSFTLSYDGMEVVDGKLEVRVRGITGLLIHNNQLVSVVKVTGVFGGETVKSSDFYAKSEPSGLVYAYVFPRTDEPEQIWVEPVEGGNGRVLFWEAEPSASEDAAGETQDEGESDAAQMREALLAALGEGSYRATWDALRSGETVRKGSKGDVARGVQQTLIDLGQNITADGDAGAKTLAALNAVQQELGLAQTDEVGAEEYQQLLLGLLLNRDPAAAEALRSQYGL